MLFQNLLSFHQSAQVNTQTACHLESVVLPGDCRVTDEALLAETT